MNLTIIEICLIIITTVLVLRNLIELIIVIQVYLKSKKALSPLVDQTKSILAKLKEISNDARETSENIKGDINNFRGNVNNLLDIVTQTINILTDLLSVINRNLSGASAFIKGFLTTFNYFNHKKDNDTDKE